MTTIDPRLAKYDAWQTISPTELTHDDAKEPAAGSLGALVAEHRRRRHLTQAETAARVRISVRSLSAIERNQTHPRPAVLVRLCDTLGIDRDEAFARR